MIKRSIASFAAALVIVALTAGPALAGDPFTKLGRGAANLLTGWVEIPKNIYTTSVEDNVFTGITLGLAKGAGMTIVRTGAGIFEIATFPFPIPDDYKPILDPEYVF